jgi:hypothetical protein
MVFKGKKDGISIFEIKTKDPGVAGFESMLEFTQALQESFRGIE